MPDVGVWLDPDDGRLPPFTDEDPPLLDEVLPPLDDGLPPLECGLSPPDDPVRRFDAVSNLSGQMQPKNVK